MEPAEQNIINYVAGKKVMGNCKEVFIIKTKYHADDSLHIT